MKKFFAFVVLILSCAALMAQTEIPIPTDPVDVYTKFEFWVGAFAPLVGLTVYLTQTIVALFKIVTGTWKQVLSWGLGAVLVVALNLLDIGLAKDLQWYGVVAYAIAVVLGANRAFDVGLLDSILKMFKLYKTPVPDVTPVKEVTTGKVANSTK